MVTTKPGAGAEARDQGMDPVRGRPAGFVEGGRFRPGRTEPIEIDSRCRCTATPPSFSVGTPPRRRLRRRRPAPLQPGRPSQGGSSFRGEIGQGGQSRDLSRIEARLRASGSIPPVIRGPNSGRTGGREGTPAPAAYALAMTPSPGTAIDSSPPRCFAMVDEEHLATLWFDRPKSAMRWAPAFS